MSTLLLRLAAPLQSWGSNSKYETRYTDQLPTKSAVVGMLAAALGWRRDHEIAPLAKALRFGVRVDQPGQLCIDYHTARPIGGKPNDNYQTWRHYLCDATFLVGFEGETSLLEDLASAIRAPAFPLFLGRRSCPPEGQVLLGIQYDKDLVTALKTYDLLTQSSFSNDAELVFRFVVEATSNDGGYFVKDEPLSFDLSGREYGYRRVVEFSDAKPLEQLEKIHTALVETDHDAFELLPEGDPTSIAKADSNDEGEEIDVSDQSST